SGALARLHFARAGAAPISFGAIRRGHAKSVIVCRNILTEARQPHGGQLELSAGSKFATPGAPSSLQLGAGQAPYSNPPIHARAASHEMPLVMKLRGALRPWGNHNGRSVTFAARCMEPAQEQAGAYAPKRSTCPSSHDRLWIPTGRSTT